MAEPERRRRRHAVSCTLCRKRKLRCNRESPCSNCVRSRNGDCVYNQLPPRPRLEDGEARAELANARTSRPLLPKDFIAVDHAPGPIPTTSGTTSMLTPASSPDVESIKSEIRRLEEQLSHISMTPKSIQSPSNTPDIDTISSGLGGTYHVYREGRPLLSSQAIPRGFTHKTRLFGQSHGLNMIVLFRDLVEMSEPRIRENPKALHGMQQCKSLARTIKAQRTPSWPCPLIEDLPPKQIANQLVECYLRTTETVYRTLHIPSFKKDYEALWTSPNKKSDQAFLLQVKLILAIGAVTYDSDFSLRDSAIHWVFEAQTALSEPEFKARLSTPYLQANILLLLAREYVDVNGSLVWTSAGSLYRTAVYMGLHRDPAYLPPKSALAGEMRRRLWNTILEINLQSSLTSGGPPLISLDDFNTQPPGNYDDYDLVAEAPVEKPESEYTQMSMARALRRTFPLRLAATKFLNAISANGTYQETMRLDAQLRAAFKDVRRTIQVFKLQAASGPSDFETRVVDFILHRYLSAVHMPFFGASLQETAYSFSRKVVVDSSLKMWYAVHPSSSSPTSLKHDNPFTRLTSVGAGFFRTVASKASLVIALELRAQLQEASEESLEPVPLRPDFLAILEVAKAWYLRSVEIGETSIKGYMLMCSAAAQIHGLRHGVRKDEMPDLLVKEVEEAEERCLPILEAIAARGRELGTMEYGVGQDYETPFLTGSELTGDLDFMASAPLFPFGDAEPMNWAFNDGNEDMMHTFR